MALETFLLYLAAWTLVALSPGPAVMYVMSQAARLGGRGVVAATSGIVSGHFVCFAAVALGLAAVLARFSGAMTVIRVIGALYLMYLGVKMLLARPRGDAAVAVAGGASPAVRGVVLQGLAVQVTNPKNLLFVLAFLPQFISPDYPLLLQLAIMLTVCVVVDGAVLLAYGYLAVRGSRALKGSRLITWIERTFGAVLIGFGINLLASRR